MPEETCSRREVLGQLCPVMILGGNHARPVSCARTSPGAAAFFHCALQAVQV